MNGTIIRALKSVPPPGANGTISSIGRLGYVCAPAVETKPSAAVAASNAKIPLFVISVYSSVSVIVVQAGKHMSQPVYARRAHARPDRAVLLAILLQRSMK
jgi:hypothetical protein